MTTMKGVEMADVVIIEWNDLMLLSEVNYRNDVVVDTKRQMIQDAIDQSYGKDGIGIMAVRGVPKFVTYKDEFLIQAHTLATKFTDEYRETNLTDKVSLYNAGWSYGKEQLGHNKPPDTSKGSFYYNPVTDTPGTEDDRKQYPYSYPCNIWPSDVPNFQQNAIQIGLLLKDVTIEIAKHLDVYVQNRLQQQRGEDERTIEQPTEITSIYQHLKDTDKVKARLLYYYPLSLHDSICNNKDHEKLSTANDAPEEDSWIGWHNDSGFLTALAGDIYINHITGERVMEDDIDPYAGLYVIDRKIITTISNDNCCNDSAKPNTTNVLKVNIPYDCCAIQIGECVQIVTGGILCATPHCVRGCSNNNNNHHATAANSIARISLPCFIDTHPSFPLLPPIGTSRQHVLNADSYSHNKVPPLALRWKETTTMTGGMQQPMTFGEFLQETFQMYYGWESTVAV